MKRIKGTPVKANNNFSDVNSNDSLIELPTKQLLLQAGYRETDLMSGIEYMNKGYNGGQSTSRRKHIYKASRESSKSKKQSMLSDNLLRQSNSRRQVVKPILFIIIAV